MKTYGFRFPGIWLTGSGMVRAKSKPEALKLANEAISKIHTGTMQNSCEQLESEDELQVIKPNEVIILHDGDY